MIKKRVKISAVYNHLLLEIKSLRKFDSSNQLNFQNGKLSKKQLHILTESLFFSGFREYENFIRDIFLLYSQEKPNSIGVKAISYLKPIDFFHAEKLIQSSMVIVDWNNPQTIIERSELYLKDGFPIKLPYSTNRIELGKYKTLRNHIAHNSTKSLESYKKLLREYYGTIPLKIPSVGQYLLCQSKTNQQNYLLLDFFDTVENMANLLK